MKCVNSIYKFTYILDAVNSNRQQMGHKNHARSAFFVLQLDLYSLDLGLYSNGDDKKNL